LVTPTQTLTLITPHTHTDNLRRRVSVSLVQSAGMIYQAI